MGKTLPQQSKIVSRIVNVLAKRHAKDPIWNMYNERNQITVLLLKLPKLRYRNQSTALIALYFKKPSVLIIAAPHYISANALSIIIPRQKFLSGNNGITIACTLQIPSNQFRIILKYT
ncbi:unnamed protein product [Onchocerca flexuosa]|uniref:Uncharacterized protein n=1 Tax=Onchocerca flexuosa TaxID=387005 RepID=A0A183I1J0_9BILA|nr:unnamed protein product [Onchocerca flexuosa]